MGRRLLLAALALLLAAPAGARADVYDDNPAAASRGAEDVWVFARRTSDGAILERHLSGGQWTDWASLGGGATSGPAAVGYGNAIHVFIRGGDGAVWTNILAGATWSGWGSLGGYTLSAPSASVRRGAVNYLDLAITGGDSALWHRSLVPGRGWSPFASQGGTLTSGPASISQTRDMLNIFARGTNGAVYQRPWTGSQWLDWLSIGGGIVGAPAAVTRREDDLDVYVRGDGNAIYQNHWDPRGWSGWLLPGGDRTPVGSSAAVVSDRSDREFLFARTGDVMAYKVWDAARGWRPWESFGAIAVPVPAVPVAPPPPPPSPQEINLLTGLGCTPPGGRLRVSVNVRKPAGQARARVSKIVFYTRGKGRATRVDRRAPFAVHIRVNRPAGKSGRIYARIYYRRSAKGKLHRKTVSRRYVVCA